MKNKNGITLVALIITIVVLIILVGVTINLTLGENGILKRAEDAKLKYQIAQAKEELDLKIAELQTEKQGTATLNDLIDILKDETDMDYIISLAEIASITGVDTIGDAKEIYVVYKIYQFRVNEKLKTEFISIVENYSPDVTITSSIKSYDGKNADGKYIAKVEVKVESKELVQSIELETVNGTITEVPTQLPYTKEIEVEIGNKYITKVIAQDGKVKKYVVEEKKEETIGSVTEFVAFRDAVNSGLTYEGKTVSLAQDIDLSSVCGEDTVNWEPIGTETTSFAGTFDGNYNIISNLYINSNEYRFMGLFWANNGTIQNLIIGQANLNNSYSDQNTSYSGTIAAINRGTIENSSVKSGNIEASGSNSSGNPRVFIGGIVGNNTGENAKIQNCYNKATITGRMLITMDNAISETGGIAGRNDYGKIINCYNSAIIKGESQSSNASGGIAGRNAYGAVIQNCYNIGTISGTAKNATNLVGGITGQIGWSSSTYGTLQNSYCIKGSATNSYYKSNTAYTTGIVESTTLQGYASTLGDAFTDDVQDEEGNYLNDGYPILKWQIGE